MKLLFLSLCFLASSIAFADLKCDNQQTVFTRGKADDGFRWAHQSVLLTSDAEILQYVKIERQISGYLSKTTNKYFESFYHFTDKAGFFGVIWLDLVSQSPSGAKVIDLRVVRSEIRECHKYDMTDCYAGDDCSMNCLDETVTPEVVHLKKRISCIED